jgi:glycosyltransferase involved in cell wall biosynthesis
VGGGAQKKRIEESVEKENIRNVHLFPFVDQADYADLLASADVSLVTLEPGMEGLCVPSKFYSILASGRPTIALVSTNSEVARVVMEADCGVQVGQGDAEALARAVQDLASHPQRVDEMGRNARVILLERYSSAHISRAYYEAIIATLENSSPSSQRISINSTP